MRKDTGDVVKTFLRMKLQNSEKQLISYETYFAFLLFPNPQIHQNPLSIGHTFILELVTETTLWLI